MSEKKEWKLLGKTCKDIVTGYEGICVSIVDYLYGCEAYGLKKQTSDDAKPEPVFFYEEQLEVIDDGISKRVKIPSYEEPAFFGKACLDKVTGIKGICVGRATTLFASPQLILEYNTLDEKADSPKILVIDEGRVEIVPDAEKEIDPADVKGKRAGGLHNISDYPKMHADIICG